MQRFTTKYWQIKFDKTSKRLYTMTKLVPFQGCKDGLAYVNPKCNTAYKQKQEQKPMVLSIDAEKAFDKI
jgi:hypothetical protein